MPTFQRREVVCDAISALSNILYDGEFELIVVVDGSTDGTAAAIRSLETPFPLRVIEQNNLGAAAARNRGAAEARGEILLFLDDDMMAAPGLLASHAQRHALGADAVIGYIPLDPQTPNSLLAAAAGRWAEDRKTRLCDGAELTLFDLLTGQLSVRRSLFEELGGFDESFTAGGQFGDEDLDLGVRLLQRGRVEFNPEAISHQRYVVTPRQYLRQWRDVGKADVLFLRKHPELANQLSALHGTDRLLHKLLVRPAAWMPGAATGLSAAAVRVAEWYHRVPSPVRPFAAALLRAARNVVYWSGFREGVQELG